MIEQPAVARAVVPLRELLLEALDVEAPYTGLALVDAAEKPHVAIVGEQIDDLVVLRLVDEVAVGVLQAADLVDVLLDRELVLELLDARGQHGNVAHESPFAPGCAPRLRGCAGLRHICMYCLQKATGDSCRISRRRTSVACRAARSSSRCCSPATTSG